MADNSMHSKVRNKVFHLLTSSTSQLIMIFTETSTSNQKQKQSTFVQPKFRCARSHGISLKARIVRAYFKPRRLSLGVRTVQVKVVKEALLLFCTHQRICLSCTTHLKYLGTSDPK